MRLPIVAVCACVILAAGVAFPVLAQVPEAQWEPFEKPPAASSMPASDSVDPANAGSSGSFEASAFAATGKMPWDEYDKQVQGSGVVGTLGPNLFGDQVEFYKNTLSFSVTDINLPGNFPLPVALTRKMAVTDRYAFEGNQDLPLADWDLDLPNISAVDVPTWADNRCSSNIRPQAPPYSGYGTDDFWNGLHANMPGGGELLRPILYDPAKPETKPSPVPTNGVSYP